MTGRFAISMRRAGLGDLLICLNAAWLFAKNTQRTLVADWRYSFYGVSRENIFPLCFEPAKDIAGVPFIADDKVGLLHPPDRRHPAVRESGRLRKLFRQPPASLTADRDRAVALIRSGHDVKAPTVVFDSCINDGLTSWHDARTFLGALRPVAHIAGAVDAFERTRLQARPWIGLHIRHGNGGDIMGHASSWSSFDDAVARCARAVEMARDRLGREALVLLCTDSLDVQAAILNRVPGVICRPKRFRVPGAGELHRSDDASLDRDDALVEMLLLARCNALIRYPAGSFFSFYAAVMKPTELPPPASVYDLLRPCDPADDLAPALLF